MSLSKNEIKLVKSLQIKKYRDLNRKFVVEGIKMVTELLAQTHFKVDAVFRTSDCDIEIPSHIHTFTISPSELERISGLKTPNKVLAVVKYPKEQQVDYDLNEAVLVLDTINDPGNLGTIIRTADWFGIKHVFASETTVDLFNPKVIQSSMGAAYRIHFHRTNLVDTLRNLASHNFDLVGAALGGSDLYTANFAKKTAIVMGSESHGIAEKLRVIIPNMVEIPRFGETESLNVAMATGIILSHYRLSIGKG